MIDTLKRAKVKPVGFSHEGQTLVIPLVHVLTTLTGAGGGVTELLPEIEMELETETLAEPELELLTL
jgi:hypothetical protein